MDDDDLLAPHRPDSGWKCGDCGQPWPCPVFCSRLRILYHREPDKLVTFMSHFRNQAAAELTDVTAAQIQARFLGWISDPPHRRLHSI